MLFEESTILRDASAGALAGAGFGGAGGYAQKAVRGNKLKNVNFNNDITRQEVKSVRQSAKEYYNDYINGTYVNRGDTGKIKFGNAGIDELTSRGLQNVKVLPNLKNQIKKGNLKSSGLDYPRDDIRSFDVIENTLNGKTYEYQIADDVATGKKFYFAKDISNKKNLSSTDRNQYPGSKIDSSIIIPNESPKLNTFSEWLEDLKRKRGHK